MLDDKKTPTEWPPEPKLEMITESFSRRDSKDTAIPHVETGDKKD